MTNGYYNTITDYPTATGAMPLLYSLRDGIPFIFETVLLSIFLILFAGNYFLNKNKTGRAKILIASVASSFYMIPLSLMLALAQLVTYASVIFYGFLTIILYILFVISDKY